MARSILKTFEFILNRLLCFFLRLLYTFFFLTCVLLCSLDGSCAFSLQELSHELWAMARHREDLESTVSFETWTSAPMGWGKGRRIRFWAPGWAHAQCRKAALWPFAWNCWQLGKHWEDVATLIRDALLHVVHVVRMLCARWWEMWDTWDVRSCSEMPLEWFQCRSQQLERTRNLQNPFEPMRKMQLTLERMPCILALWLWLVHLTQTDFSVGLGVHGFFFLRRAAELWFKFNTFSNLCYFSFAMAAMAKAFAKAGCRMNFSS